MSHLPVCCISRSRSTEELTVSHSTSMRLACSLLKVVHRELRERLRLLVGRAGGAAKLEAEERTREVLALQREMSLSVGSRQGTAQELYDLDWCAQRTRRRRCWFSSIAVSIRAVGVAALARLTMTNPIHPGQLQSVYCSPITSDV